jgi:hypothetical protein
MRTHALTPALRGGWSATNPCARVALCSAVCSSSTHSPGRTPTSPCCPSRRWTSTPTSGRTSLACVGAAAYARVGPTVSALAAVWVVARRCADVREAGGEADGDGRYHLRGPRPRHHPELRHAAQAAGVCLWARTMRRIAQEPAGDAHPAQSPANRLLSALNASRERTWAELDILPVRNHATPRARTRDVHSLPDLTSLACRVVLSHPRLGLCCRRQPSLRRRSVPLDHVLLRRALPGERRLPAS